MRAATTITGLAFCLVAIGCSADAHDVDEPSAASEHAGAEQEDIASSDSALHRQENSGTVAWARGLFELPSFLRSDGAGNAYASGIQNVNGVNQLFVLKYTPTGFRTKFGFDVTTLSAFGAASDGTLGFAGRVETNDSADFGCGPVPRFHSYVAVIRPDRSCAWMTTTTGGTAKSVTFGPSGEVVVSGTVSGTDYDLGDGVLRSSFPLVYPTRLNANGTHDWSKVFGDGQSTSTSNQVPTGADVDASGRIHLLGRFRQTINFGGGTLTAAPGSNFEFATGFLASFTSAGTYIRARAFGTSVNPATVDAAPDGSVVIGGRFGGTIQFDNKSLSNTSATRDIFLATFKPGTRSRGVGAFTRPA